MSYELTLNDWLPPADDVAWDRVRLEFSQTGDPLGTDWTADTVQSITEDATPLNPDAIDITTTAFPWLEGYVRAVFLHPDDSESLPSSPVYTMVTWNGGLLGMVPRVGRALQGFSVTLSTEQLLALTADAVAEVIFYVPGWGKTIVVTSRDANNVPLTFEVTPELTIPEQTVVVSQAALNYFYHETGGGKTAERISDEGQTWEIENSAQLLTKTLDQLKAARDAALAQLEELDAVPVDGFVSFIAVRDNETSRQIESYYYGAGNEGGQQVDYRFGGVC